ncbi:MAG: GWxTD domain-containing protein [Bacteroidota bacterium]
MQFSVRFPWRLLMVVLIATVGAGIARGQVEMRRGVEKDPPTFFFDAMCYSSDKGDKSRIDVYVQIPHTAIKFAKEGDNFFGRYDVTLSAFTPSEQLVLEQNWSKDVRVDNFVRTTSNRFYSLTQRSIDIDPGQYHLLIQVRDFESQKTSEIRRALVVTDFNKDPLSMSDIMLVNRLSTDGERKSIVPIVSGNVAQQTDGFFTFFEVYNRAKADSVELTVKVRSMKNEEVFHHVQVEGTPEYKSQSFVKIDPLNLSTGTYVLTVDARQVHPTEGDSSEVIAQTSRTFSVRTDDLPAAVLDLSKAVDQLLYIARDNELRYIRDAEGEEERRRRFVEFWSKRDPDPQTPRNELMEEYYLRVEHANKSFTHYLEGWRTDMGMVYIRFGAPENVERHPFDQNAKPYEVWYYYQLNRQFVFVDETGFGDYRLRYPTTDLWGRIR